MSDFDAKLGDPWWRLNNLYKIKDKAGDVITFNWNWAQEEFYQGMWYLNLILKARQLGMTTAIQIFMLDRCLFNDNVNAGIVAHNKEDAEAFFDDKIKFAYDNLPADLRGMLKATSDTARSLEFSNGSKIRVGTSLRSGTYQYVHVSEFGKMCAKYPDKAEEVTTGTLNTVAPGQMVFIESTAEGPHGDFYKMCQKYEALADLVAAGEAHLTPLDYKFFFFPWWRHPDYVLDQKVDIAPKMELYFRELRDGDPENNTPPVVELRSSQKAWYSKKADEQGEKMKQEYPSTPAEAFENTGELKIYGKQMRAARRDKRITRVPMVTGVPVNTFWDLGRNDVTAIWFHQHVEVRHHFIYYFEDRLMDLTYYAEQLAELRRIHGWIYGKHYLPHDVEVTDLSSVNNLSRRKILSGAGVNPIVVVPKPASVNDDIEVVRKKFSECYFDAEACEIGLTALGGYQWTFDEKFQTIRKTPAHTWASNGADAFRQFAIGYRGKGATFREQVAAHGGDGRNPRKYAQRSRGSLLNPSTDHVV